MKKPDTSLPIKRIAILMAMQAEAQPIIDSLQLLENAEAFNSLLPMRCFQAQLGEISLSVVVAGQDDRFSVDNIGSEASVLMAYETIQNLEPDLILSAGTAGGFASKGAEIGTVYVSDKHFVFHDRHVPLPGFDKSSVGMYPALKVDTLATDLNLQKGIVSTGSSLEKSDKDVRVIDEHNAVAKEMEAAGIAWVAMLHEIPFMAFKSITNLIDEDNKSEDEFVKNLQTSSKSLHDTVLEFIDYVQEKSVDDLA